MRKGLFTAVLIAGLVLLGSGCASTPETGEEEFRAAAEEIWEKFSTSLLTEDLELFASIHMEEVVKLTPGKPPIVGFEQEKQAKAAAFANGSFESFEVGIDEAEVYGELGFSRGTVTYVFVPDAGGGKMEIEGKYITLFRKQPDGSWKIYRGCTTPGP